MTQKELGEILDKHTKWLNEEDGGERANLLGADLRGLNLRKANLSEANLLEANFLGAYLRGASLIGADLRYAKLIGTNLTDTILINADLRYANLSFAKLHDAILDGADYTGTVLNLQCPEEDSFTAWKKLEGDNIAKLLIPEDAKRSSATSRKCRSSKAIVLAIYNKNGEEISEGRSVSRYHSDFIYRVGETVYPDSWDEDRWNECSNGIHFFVTRKEAEEYQ